MITHTLAQAAGLPLFISIMYSVEDNKCSTNYQKFNASHTLITTNNK